MCIQKNSMYMASFRSNIISQIEAIPLGKIFTLKDLTFVPSKRANVAVVLSELSKKEIIVRAEQGAYYKPKKSLLGLKNRVLSYQEKLDFVTTELNGYITGPYIYNQLRLTEQVPMIITIATENPVRKFEKLNIRFECVKSYVSDFNSVNLYYLRLLDAIKSIKRIPGTTPSDVYNRLLCYHFNKFGSEEINIISNLSLTYPPRVRRILMDICDNLGFSEESYKLSQTLNSNTSFKSVLN